MAFLNQENLKKMTTQCWFAFTKSALFVVFCYCVATNESWATVDQGSATPDLPRLAVTATVRGDVVTLSFPGFYIECGGGMVKYLETMNQYLSNETIETFRISINFRNSNFNAQAILIFALYIQGERKVTESNFSNLIKRNLSSIDFSDNPITDETHHGMTTLQSLQYILTACPNARINMGKNCTLDLSKLRSHFPGRI